MKFSAVLSAIKPRSPRMKRIATGSAFLLLAALMSASIFATGPQALPVERTEKSFQRRKPSIRTGPLS